MAFLHIAPARESNPAAWGRYREDIIVIPYFISTSLDEEAPIVFVAIEGIGRYGVPNSHLLAFTG